MQKKRVLSILTAASMTAALMATSGFAATTVDDYTDVDADAWYYNYVKTLTEEQVFIGTNDGTTFSPEVTLTRGQFVRIIYNIEVGNPGEGTQEDDSTVDTSMFADGDELSGKWYAAEMVWAYEQGIVEGVALDTTSDAIYASGEAVISRAEMATMIGRYIDWYETNKGYSLKDYDGSWEGLEVIDEFLDQDEIDSTASWAADEIELLRAKGIVYGKGDDKYHPSDELSRAEAAAIVYRLDWIINETEEEQEEENPEETPEEEEIEETDYLALATDAATSDAQTYADDMLAAFEAELAEYGYTISDETIDLTIDFDYDSEAAAEDTRTVNVVADLTLGDEADAAAVQFVEWATTYVCELVDGGTLDLTVSDVKEVISSFADALGIELDTTSLTTMAQSVYDELAETGKTFWKEYKNYDGTYPFETVTVTCGSVEFSLIVEDDGASIAYDESLGTAKQAAVKLATALGQDLYASLKENNTNDSYSLDSFYYDLTADGTITLTFNEVLDEMESFPTVYDCVITANLESDYLGYQYVDTTSYFQLLFTTVAQETYAEAVDQVADTVIYGEEFHDTVSDAIADEIADYDSIAYLDSILESDVASMIAEAADEWFDDNVDAVVAYFWDEENPADELTADDMDNTVLYELNDELVQEVADLLVAEAQASVENWDELDTTAQLSYLAVAIEAAKYQTYTDYDAGDTYNLIYNYAAYAVSGDESYLADNEDLEASIHYDIDELVVPIVADYFEEKLAGLLDYKYLTEEDLGSVELGRVLHNQYVIDIIQNGLNESLVDSITNMLSNSYVENSSITIAAESGDIVIDSELLAGLAEAETTDELASALMDLAETDLGTLCMNDFAGEGLEVTVNYNEQELTFNFVITFETEE